MIKPGIIAALLFICIALLTAVYFIKGDRPTADTPLKIGGTLVEGIEPPDINSIGIKKGAVQVTLQRKGTGWMMPSHNNRIVSDKRMQELIHSLLHSVVVDTREAHDEDFELDPERRVEITINSAGEPRKIYIGASSDTLAASAPARSFARTLEEGPVYEVGEALDVYAGVVTESDQRVLDPRRFYDLKICKLNPVEVIDIAIKKKHKAVRVQRVIPDFGPVPVDYRTQPGHAKPVWWITEPQGFPAEPAAVSQILTQLMEFDAKSYADNITLEDAGLKDPEAQVRIQMRSGEERKFLFGKMDGDQVYMQVDKNENIFTVYRYRFDSMTLSFDELKDKEAISEVESVKPDQPKDVVVPKVNQTKRTPVEPPPPRPAGPKFDPKPVDTVIIPAASPDKK